jgi:hypothetical protein
VWVPELSRSQETSLPQAGPQTVRPDASITSATGAHTPVLSTTRRRTRSEPWPVNRQQSISPVVASDASVTVVP